MLSTLIVLPHIAVIEGVIGTHLAVVSVEAVVLKVFIDMASVVFACVKAFLSCQLFGSLCS